MESAYMHNIDMLFKGLGAGQIYKHKREVNRRLGEYWISQGDHTLSPFLRL